MERKIGNYIVNIETGIEGEFNFNHVLYIPMYSMREYNSGKYNLAADGNVNRFLSKLSMCQGVNLFLAVPPSENCINYDFLLKALDKLYDNKNLRAYKLINTPCYAENALATRNNEKWKTFMLFWENEPFNKVIFEPNIIGRFIPAIMNQKIIYWLPVSQVKGADIKFVMQFKQQDEENIKRFKTYVCSRGQQELWPSTILDNNIFNPQFFIDIDKLQEIKLSDAIIFNPFRQSDPGYKIKEIYEAIKIAEAEGKSKYIVLYTAPNNFEVPTTINKLKVESNREVYYSILKSRPVVIYLENPDEILHVGLFEFIHFNCRIIYVKNSVFHHEKYVGELKKNWDIKCLKDKISFQIMFNEAL